MANRNAFDDSLDSDRMARALKDEDRSLSEWSREGMDEPVHGAVGRNHAGQDGPRELDGRQGRGFQQGEGGILSDEEKRGTMGTMKTGVEEGSTKWHSTQHHKGGMLVRRQNVDHGAVETLSIVMNTT